MKTNRLVNISNNFHDDESFESLVDLFTLISISLILATVVYGFKSNLIMETTETPIKEIIDQAGTADVSLDNVLIIYITNDGLNDKIIFNDSMKGRRVSDISRKSVTTILTGEFSYINNAREIALTVDLSGTDTTQAIFTDVQRWMSAMEMGHKVSIGFAR